MSFRARIGQFSGRFSGFLALVAEAQLRVRPAVPDLPAGHPPQAARHGPFGDRGDPGQLLAAPGAEYPTAHLWVDLVRGAEQSHQLAGAGKGDPPRPLVASLRPRSLPRPGYGCSQAARIRSMAGRTCSRATARGAPDISSSS